MTALRRLASSVVLGTGLVLAHPVDAQTCPVPASKDVLLYLDNSGSISNAEFDAAQQAIADIAVSVLSVPGYRLAVVNWACLDHVTYSGCRLDLATGSAIPGGWSSNPADFAYAGNNSPANKVCRSFGSTTGFGERNNCGGPNWTQWVSADFAQHALKMLDAALYSGGGTGGPDGYGAATLAPAPPIQDLMILHMTDATASGSSLIREPPTFEAGLGNYYYSNYLKNQRNALIVGVGIDLATAPAPSAQLGALSSKGGTGTAYDIAHISAPSTQVADTGTPRLSALSATYSASTILAATQSVFQATQPACLVVRKKSVDGVGSFSFTDGTNGVPTNFSLTTVVAGTPVGTAFSLSSVNTDTEVRETIPSGWALTSIECTNSSNSSVAVTADLGTGQLVVPGAAITSGARITCTFTNRLQPDLQVVKTATPDPVVSGDIVTYQIVVSNPGLVPVSNAVLTDVAGAGQDCTLPASTATCTASGGAVCPATIPVADLLGSGVTIPSLPVGGQVTVSLQCTVTASGQP